MCHVFVLCVFVKWMNEYERVNTMLTILYGTVPCLCLLCDDVAHAICLSKKNYPFKCYFLLFVYCLAFNCRNTKTRFTSLKRNIVEYIHTHTHLLIKTVSWVSAKCTKQLRFIYSILEWGPVNDKSRAWNQPKKNCKMKKGKSVLIFSSGCVHKLCWFDLNE